MRSKNDLVIPFTWEERRPALLDQFFYLPKQYDHQDMHLDFSTIFSNDRPVHLEICSGNGQWIGDQARLHSEVNWVAVELRFDRARKIWLKRFREEIPNLFVVCAEGAAFLRHYVKPSSISASYINFPDPWPKRSHGKHRLIWVPFLELLHRAMKKGGALTVVTDDAQYHDQIVREFAKAGSWQPIPFEPVAYGDSFFADLWKEKGREIYYEKYAVD